MSDESPHCAGYNESTASYIVRILEQNHQLKAQIMDNPLEQQLIDNENRVALMATQLLAAYISRVNRVEPQGDNIEMHAKWAVAVAIAITKEVGKEAEKVKGEL